MSPILVAAVRTVIADWHREADGSRSMAEYHARAVAEALEAGKAQAAVHEQTAAEHRRDADSAAAAAAALEAALREEGVEP